jgi:hypothetical protein
VKEIFQYGAVAEDFIGPEPRVVYHFFDSQNNRGLTIGNKAFETSPNWALEDAADADILFPLSQQFSYRDAREYFLKSLTSSTPTDREQFFGLTIKTLGQVAHHLQDMAQPQHTRNEVHCNNRIFCDWILESVSDNTYYRPSEYESYIGQQNHRIVSGDIATTTYPVRSVAVSSQFLEPRDFWTNPNVQNGGMADFTSANFPTELSMVRWNPQQGVFGPHPNFPLPNGSGIAYEFSPCLRSGGQGTISGVCGRLISTVTDPVSNQTKQQDFANISIIWAPLTSELLSKGAGNQYVDGLFTVGENIFEAQFETLAPRMVAFSTGLIDYFFRGKPELIFDGIYWRVGNFGNETLDGVFSLYSENASGVRTAVRNNGWATRTLMLPPRAISAPILYDLPSDNNGKYALVFEGRLGTEGLAGTNALTAVAGQVKSLPKISIRYGDNGPLLDDIFTLRVRDVSGYAPDYLHRSTLGRPTRSESVDLTLPPGKYQVEIIFDNRPPNGDHLTDANGGGTYFIEFSSNVIPAQGGSPMSGIVGQYRSIASLSVTIPDE